MIDDDEEQELILGCFCLMPIAFVIIVIMFCL
jgi:hypothetical protein